MLGRRRSASPLDDLSPREREVLAAMAEGKSNRGIAETLVVTEAAVEKHVTHIFHKLGLGATSDRASPRAGGPHLPARVRTGHGVSATAASGVATRKVKLSTR